MKPIDRHVRHTLPDAFALAMREPGADPRDAMLRAIATAIAGIATDDPANAVRMARNAAASTAEDAWERLVNALVVETVGGILNEWP